MSDVDVLNRMLAVEHLGIAAYDAALGTRLLDGATAEAAQAFEADHVKHREVLVERVVARGGKAVPARDASDYAKAFPSLTTAAEIVAYAIQTEAGAARLYIASIAELEDKSLAVLSAEIAGVEAQHWAVLLAASGKNPVPSPFIDVKVSAGSV